VTCAEIHAHYHVTLLGLAESGHKFGNKTVPNTMKNLNTRRKEMLEKPTTSRFWIQQRVRGSSCCTCKVSKRLAPQPLGIVHRCELPDVNSTMTIQRRLAIRAAKIWARSRLTT